MIDRKQGSLQMTLTADRPSARKVPLKEQGIYAFPDGTQVVACAGDGRGLVLYYLRDWKLYGAKEVLAERNAAAFRLLEANPTGSILIYGYPTRWTVEDLVDTGRVAT
ncbi:MAG TPA: hypothetical protein VGX92_05635 [Pyrinomonadaceae bacterium]|nr:hypothetical protein [Pyrinomonadaceae bacterium]